jgi:hypothetical protein
MKQISLAKGLGIELGEEDGEPYFAFVTQSGRQIVTAQYSPDSEWEEWTMGEGNLTEDLDVEELIDALATKNAPDFEEAHFYFSNALPFEVTKSRQVWVDLK